MVFESPVVIFDACILYPFHLRNIVVQTAVDRLVQARWTEAIHEEWIRSLSANDRKLPAAQLIAARDLMNAVLRNATVAGYESVIPSVTLPDPDDRHVVAAAVTARASVIITWNMRDFPQVELRKHGLAAQTPDVFLTDLYKQRPDTMIQVTARARRNLRQSRVSASEFLAALRKQRFARFTSAIEPHQAKL